MVRARLAYLAVGSGLLLASGCASMHENECHNGGWFSKFKLTSRTSATATAAAPCECEGSMGVPSMDSPGMMVPPNAFMPPPGAYTAPPMMMTNPPAGTQPPRVVPIPQQQANPSPYSPQQ